MRCRNALIGLPLIALLPLLSVGQEASPRAPEERVDRPASLSPTLRDDKGQPLEGISLASADVHAIVRGPLAEVVVTLTFRNALDRILGGELTFPLPEGATVSGYGLDVHGTMVDGVAVEKHRARIIYETEMNRRIDPGYVEHVVGNNFRTRLYPIPAKGTRSIKISYVMDLVPSAGKKGATLALPMGFGDNLEKFDLTLAVEGATVTPTVRGGTYANKPFEQVDRGFYLKDSLRNAKAVDDLIVTLPEVPVRSVTVGDADRADETDAYFVITDTPENPKPDRLPMIHRRLLLVWDASLGRRWGKLDQELSLLNKALARLDYPSVDLVLLRNDLELGLTVGAGKAEAEKLIAALKDAACDGATNLSALRFPKNRAALVKAAGPAPVPAWWRARADDYDFALLFSDGVGNLGGPTPAAIDIPVYAVSADISAHHQALQAICRQSGGVYLNLNRTSEDAAALAIGQPVFSIIAIETDSRVADVFPGAGTALNGRVTIAGRLSAPWAKLTVVYGFGDIETSRQTFEIKPEKENHGTLVSRYWAQQKLNELMLDADANHDKMLALGRRYNIVTPATSLLVLETLDQYVRYRVVPPRSQPQLYEAYVERVANTDVAEREVRQKKTEEVLARWQARVALWDRPFEVPKNFVYDGEYSERSLNRPPQPAHPQQDQQRQDFPDFRLEKRRSGDADLGGSGGGGLFGGGGGGSGGGGLFGGSGGQTSSRQPPIDNAWRDAPDFNLQTGKSSSEPAALTPEELAEAERVQAQPWDSKAPYLNQLRYAPVHKIYQVYLARREAFLQSPSFYFDFADRLLRAGRRAEGVRVLTSVLELKLDDPRIIRIVANRLQAIGEYSYAVELFEKVLRLRPEEAVSLRDAALARAARGDDGLAQMRIAAIRGNVVPADVATRIPADYSRALDLLNQILTTRWARFDNIDEVALTDANGILAKIAANPQIGAVRNPIDPQLLANVACDIRIVLTWDADQTDMDLMVTEPSLEICSERNRITSIGGSMSDAVTQGYGPQQYLLQSAMPGEYKIRANFVGSRQQEITGPCTVHATVITNFGRPNERRRILTARLSTPGKSVVIGTFRH